MAPTGIVKRYRPEKVTGTSLVVAWIPRFSTMYLFASLGLRRPSVLVHSEDGSYYNAALVHSKRPSLGLATLLVLLAISFITSKHWKGIVKAKSEVRKGVLDSLPPVP
jgi:hypothetical protein